MSWPEDIPSGPTQQSCKAKLRITHPKVTVPAMSRWCCPPPVIKTKTTPQSHTISRALLQTTKALQKRIKTDKEVSMVIGKFTLYSPTQYTLYLNDPAGLQHLWYISSKNTWAVQIAPVVHRKLHPETITQKLWAILGQKFSECEIWSTWCANMWKLEITSTTKDSRLNRKDLEDKSLMRG